MNHIQMCFQVVLGILQGQRLRHGMRLLCFLVPYLHVLAHVLPRLVSDSNRLLIPFSSTSFQTRSSEISEDDSPSQK